MRTKKILLLSVLAAILFAGAGGVFYRNFSAVPAQQVVTVISSKEQTALKLLQDSHKVIVKQYSFGTMVEGIDGLVANKDHFWLYYVNGKAAEVGADQYVAKPGDVVEWRYEKAK